MAKLPRAFQYLYGRDGDQSHFGQFGSRAAGLPFNTKDPNSIQALSAFLTNGWLDAINAGNKAPFLEDMNGLFFLMFYQLCYQFQEGVAEWNISTTYYIGSIVKAPGTSDLYGSLTDNNTGNALPTHANNANWKFLGLPPSVQQVSTATVTTSSLVPLATGLSQAITPTDATRRIKVSISGIVTVPGSGNAAVIHLFRGAVDLGVFSQLLSDAGAGTTLDAPCAFTYVDSPGSASPQTYSVRIASSSGANNVIWNRPTANTVLQLEEVL